MDATCALDAHSIIEVDGSFCRYVPRSTLSENLFDRPSWAVHNCVGRNIVNEAPCRGPDVSVGGMPLSSLRVEIRKSEAGVFVSYSVGTDAVRYGYLVDSVVNRTSTTSVLPGWPLRFKFFARWTGWETISTGATYIFSLDSDNDASSPMTRKL